MNVEELTDSSSNKVKRTVHVTKDSTYIITFAVYTTSLGKDPLSKGSMRLEENLVVFEALRWTKLAVIKTEDVKKSSNLSIITLPLIIKFVPVALIAYLKTCGTLLCIIFGGCTFLFCFCWLWCLCGCDVAT